MATYNVVVDLTYRTELVIEARSEESARAKALKMAAAEVHSAPTVVLDTQVAYVEEQ